MLHFDPVALLRDDLALSRRPPDGKLHPSGDLIGSLRHAQLRAAGAPTVTSNLVSDIRLMTGTMWHTRYEDILHRFATSNPDTRIKTEIKLDRWLPEGWSGTADWIIWNPQVKAWVLGDLKTIKGEGIKWVEKDGIKDEHMWQLSSYWYALEATGVPLVNGFCVLYLPQNVPTDSPDVEPVMMEGEPLAKDLVLGVMNDRWAATTRYLAGVQAEYDRWEAETGEHWHAYPTDDCFLNEHLAEPMDRIQKVLWNKGQGCFDVKLCPHWSTDYCPFPDELCDCSTQGVTKIGQFDTDGVYTPRKGFEHHEPAVAPSIRDLNKRKEEVSG